MTTMEQWYRRARNDVHCPRCHVGPGKRCLQNTTLEYRQVPWVHPERMALYQARHPLKPKES